MSSKVFRNHALLRMSQRGISDVDVLNVLETGETVEEYPDDFPFPSRLVLGWLKNRPIHVVVAHNTDQDEWIVITAYEPDSRGWIDGFRRRKT